MNSSDLHLELNALAEDLVAFRACYAVPSKQWAARLARLPMDHEQALEEVGRQADELAIIARDERPMPPWGLDVEDFW